MTIKTKFIGFEVQAGPNFLRWTQRSQIRSLSVCNFSRSETRQMFIFSRGKIIFSFSKCGRGILRGERINNIRAESPLRTEGSIKGEKKNNSQFSFASRSTLKPPRGFQLLRSEGRSRLISCYCQSAQSSNQELKELRIFLKYCLDILRDNEHLVNEKALRTLTFLLILKRLEPLILNNQIDFDNFNYQFQKITIQKQKVSNLVKFSNLAKIKPQNLNPSDFQMLWDDILAQHPKTAPIFRKGQGFGIKQQHTWAKLIAKINEFPFHSYEVDIQGCAYEEVIKNTMTGKYLGQFFTPQSVKQFMVELINPQVRLDGTVETIFDPALGTGGFLITALKYLIYQAFQKNITLDWSFISTQGVGGREVEPDTYQLARGNLLISTGLLFEHLELGDSIKQPITKKFDIVLTNVPFGIQTLNYNAMKHPLKTEYIPIQTNNAVLLFLQAIISMLKIGGRAAIVLPFGQELFSQKKEFIAVRQYLLKTCLIKQIIKLPKGIFSHTNIETCIIYFTKETEGKDVLTTNIKSSKKTNKEIHRTYEFKGIDHNQTITFCQYSEIDNKSQIHLEIDIQNIVKYGYCLYDALFQYLKQEDAKQYEPNIVVKTLGEICNFLPKSKTPVSSAQEKGSYPFFRSSLIVDRFVEVPDYCEESLIIGDGGGPNIHYATSFSASDHCYILQKKKNVEAINLKYVYYYLSHNLNSFEILYIGTGLKNISKEYLEMIRLPLPPLEQQNAIVQKIEQFDLLSQNVSTYLNILIKQQKQVDNSFKSSIENISLNQSKEDLILSNLEQLVEQLKTLTSKNQQ